MNGGQVTSVNNLGRSGQGNCHAIRLQDPHAPSDTLFGMKDCYKIKLRNAGYRLVYEVDDGQVVVTVVAVGKRNGA